MTKLKSFILSLGLSLLLFSCNSYQTLLRHHQNHSVTLRDSNSHIVAHLMLERNHTHLSPKLSYYSFKSGKLYKTQGALNGTALHGDYREMYLSGELKEAGVFNHGLRDGTWKTWYSNGNLQKIEHYNKGKLQKKVINYSIDGQEIKKVRTKKIKDKKQGKQQDKKQDKQPLLKKLTTKKDKKEEAAKTEKSWKFWKKINFKKKSE